MNKWIVALIVAIVVIFLGYHYWGRSDEAPVEVVGVEEVAVPADESAPAAEAPAEAAPAQTILVEDPFTPATEGDSAAVFMEIRNESDATDNLVGASSPLSAKTELHSHQTEGSIVKMVPVQEVSLPAHEKVSFMPGAPGGFHVMLMGLSAPLKAGDQVPVELSFEKGGKMNIVATVRPAE